MDIGIRLFTWPPADRYLSHKSLGGRSYLVSKKDPGGVQFRTISIGSQGCLGHCLFSRFKLLGIPSTLLKGPQKKANPTTPKKPSETCGVGVSLGPSRVSVATEDHMRQGEKALCPTTLCPANPLLVESALASNLVVPMNSQLPDLFAGPWPPPKSNLAPVPLTKHIKSHGPSTVIYDLMAASGVS